LGKVGLAGRMDQVKVYEEPLTLPTYRIGEPEIMPHWGRWLPHMGRLYPYTMLDKLTDQKYDRTYRALWLENEYVKALVLPEIGGRLHGAQDKTNGYQFLYDQRVIKPGLVGMTGAWIPGGMEWNFPHGHRPTGFRDTDWRIVENTDGSKTVWTGEIERIFGMRWSAGITVHPGRNWVETKVRLYNCTPFAHSFAYWATGGVRATPEYQAVIPAEIVAGHYKQKFYRWPVHEGVDLSCWQNTADHTSYFAWESEKDYFGGYSPEEQAGLAHVADHHIVRGKKLWTWGTAPSGRIWERILSDGDLPYLEPQAGAYSDNQPDYHWIMPGETKIFSHFWFPVRDIGVWDYANMEGSLSLKLHEGVVKFGWSPTGRNKGARIILTADGTEIFRRTMDADPANPFVAEFKAPRGTELFSLKLTVLAAGGETLLAFRHPEPANPSLPEPEPPFQEPGKIESQDELFVLGDYMEKFRDSALAMNYYREALSRDPGDVRTNTAVGLLLLKRGEYLKALEHFAQALKRQPSFAKARYYQGLSQSLLGEIAEAVKSLNRASYDSTWYSAAHFELAQLTASQGRWERALEHIGRSLKGNSDSAQAHAVKALVLNRLGHHREALETALTVQAFDPLDLLSLSERVVALNRLGRREEAAEAAGTLLHVSRCTSENQLELAIRYARCGLYEDAVGTLRMIADRDREESKDISPLVYYYLAYYSELLGNKGQSAEFRSTGSRISPEYCFPNRLESLPVLCRAVEYCPEDANAHYLLGNLYYSKELAEEAIGAWERAVALEPSNVVAHRNLGYAWMHKNQPGRARTAYETAVETDPGQAVLAMLELDNVYASLKFSVGQRVASLEKYIEQVSGSDAVLKRLISLYIRAGRYGEALKWLNTHHFHTWESRYDVHQYWVESHLRQGRLEFEAGNYGKALEHYTLSLTYPPNLEIDEQPDTIHARKRYYVALALEALGRKEEAGKMFETVAQDNPKPGSAFQYYRGKALEKLGQKDRARRVYRKMLEDLERHGVSESEHIIDGVNYDTGRNPEAVHLFRRSLALEGLGRSREAESERKKALKLDPLVSFRAFSPPKVGWYQ